eukprot:TRINITY_DN543_c0_g2_i1.p2 TRINITY_DN543_c0_g2~~TRINITY_DN543_c0_g2_i1.p2  ORF type:complete len:115 (-),score=26.64 TRINITY_DN543_c0_g2_i1:368-712(-)
MAKATIMKRTPRASAVAPLCMYGLSSSISLAATASTGVADSDTTWTSDCSFFAASSLRNSFFATSFAQVELTASASTTAMNMRIAADIFSKFGSSNKEDCRRPKELQGAEFFST